MNKQVPFPNLMFQVPSNVDARDARLAQTGQDLLLRLEATKAIAWQLAFRRWFRPPICQRTTED